MAIPISTRFVVTRRVRAPVPTGAPPTVAGSGPRISGGALPAPLPRVRVRVPAPAVVRRGADREPPAWDGCPAPVFGVPLPFRVRAKICSFSYQYVESADESSGANCN